MYVENHEEQDQFPLVYGYCEWEKESERMCACVSCANINRPNNQFNSHTLTSSQW